MKTFKDLSFEPNILGGLQATMNFKNGYGVFLINIDNSLWTISITYNGSTTRNIEIADGILTNQSDQDVTEVMKKVQKLKE